MLAIVNDIRPPDNPSLTHSALQGDAGDSEFGTQNPDPEGVAPKAVSLRRWRSVSQAHNY